MKAATRLTLDEFLALPEEKPYREYACGEVWKKPMPNRPHSVLQTWLVLLLSPFVRRQRIGDIFAELRCVFGPPGGERALVPDLCFYRRGRLIDDPQREPYPRIPPDLVIEVLSPRQNARRFADKLQFYLGNGVRLVWVVDPASETVTVYALGAQSRLLRAGDTLDGGDVLPGFAVPVDEVFAQLRG
jgi:Uma2 family endonuclease